MLPPSGSFYHRFVSWQLMELQLRVAGLYTPPLEKLTFFSPFVCSPLFMILPESSTTAAWQELQRIPSFACLL